MSTTSRLRPYVWIMGALSYPLFFHLGVRDHLFVGHDHWCSGHVMMMAKSFLDNDFSTPYFVPSENPYERVGGWALYTGWPPLLPILLAFVLNAFGESLFVARAFAALWTTVSAMLIVAIAWRVTRSTWAAVAAGVIFAGHLGIGVYCCFVCFETPALTWSLLLLYLYPKTIRSNSTGQVVAYLVLTAIGGLLSWQCYLAPPACALALALSDRPSFRAHCWKALLPTACAVLVGVLLIAVYRVADGQFTDAQAPSVRQRLLLRLGWAGNLDLGQFRGSLANWAMESGMWLWPFVGVIACILGTGGHRASDAELENDPEPRFFVLALWIFPVAWTAFLPHMSLHDFQRIFFVPALAVTLPWLTHCALFARGFSRKARTLVWCFVFLIAGCILQLSAQLVERAYRRDIPTYVQLEKDATDHFDNDAIAVLGIENKGAWWRLDRPVLAIGRIDRVRDRKHFVVTALAASPPGPDYVQVVKREIAHPELPGYAIYRPKTPADAPDK